MRKFVTSLVIPPVGACRYGCGTNCAAPVTVFWIFGVISVIFGFFGGPAGETGISWYTISLGLAMWGIAAVWAILTFRGVEEDNCHGAWSPLDHKITPSDRETDPFEEIKKAH